MDDLDTATLLWGLLFGSIGLGYFMYGRKQRSLVPFISGIGLMGIPYIISNVWVMVLLCIGLMLLPKYIRYSS